MVLHQSKLVANTSIDQLRKPTEPSVRVVFEEDITTHLSDPFFQKLNYEQIDKRALVIKSTDEQGVKKSILNFALDKGLNIQSLHTQEASLEEIFKLLTH
jgi:ABC-type multidrug transport system ATPase subunit